MSRSTPTTAVSIRPVEAKDEQRWRELWHGYNVWYKREDRISEDITAHAFKTFLDKSHPSQCAVAAIEDGTLVGFVTWMPHTTTASIKDILYLNDLFVDETKRVGRVGRALIEHVYKVADEDGNPGVYWHTQRFNHAAQLLYTKVGELSDFVKYVRPSK